MSGGAGGDPLAVLTVDGGALQALEAAARLLCHRVFRPNRETFNCVSKKKNGCFVLTRGREGIAARCVSTFYETRWGEAVSLSLRTDLGRSISAGGSACFRSSRAGILRGCI